MGDALYQEERRCQKCGTPTKGEEAWVNGQAWCHPCADMSKDILEGSRQIRELLIKALIVATGASEDAIREAPLTTALKFRDGLKNARSDLESRILEYANDLRRNSSGGDDYPWEYAKATADYLETLIARSRSAGTI